MKNCYNLDLNFSPLRNDFVYPISNLEKRVLHAYGENILSDSCKHWIFQAGLRFHKLFIFEDPGVNNVRIVHIDGANGIGKQFAINWNIGKGKFVTEWFKISNESVSNSFDLNTHPYTVFNECDAELIESSISAGPMLFNTSAPHSVMNLDNNVRYGITLRFFNKLSWEESVSFLSKYIKYNC